MGRGVSHVPTEGIVSNKVSVLALTLSTFTVGGLCTSHVPTDGLSLNPAAAVLATAMMGSGVGFASTGVSTECGTLFNQVPTDGFKCVGTLPITGAGTAFGVVADFVIFVGNFE
mmetsp:Transcript_49130/g.118077  ORF Transcript_49130/g.118077 Transcript_49130/m.118077 type:complete len:114 (+) Transcript_49130:614-955(+)